MPASSGKGDTPSFSVLPDAANGLRPLDRSLSSGSREPTLLSVSAHPRADSVRHPRCGPDFRRSWPPTDRAAREPAESPQPGPVCGVVQRSRMPRWCSYSRQWEIAIRTTDRLMCVAILHNKIYFKSLRCIIYT